VDGPEEPVTAGEAAASDRSLLLRFRRGSEDAATQIYLRYAHRLRGLAAARTGADLAARVDADDIVQSVFGSFFRGASRGYYDVPAGEELWKLFLVIALNKIRAKALHHRAGKRDVRRTAGGDALDAAAGPASVEAPAAFLQVVIDDALSRLPPAHAEMMTLRVAGYEVAEIAGKTGRSKRTVERVLQKCRGALTELFHESD